MSEKNTRRGETRRGLLTVAAARSVICLLSRCLPLRGVLRRGLFTVRRGAFVYFLFNWRYSFTRFLFTLAAKV